MGDFARASRRRYAAGALIILFTLLAVLTGCNLLGIGEDLPERVTLEVPLTHVPEHIVMEMDERFGLCRPSDWPYAAVDWLPSCRRERMAAGVVAVVEHFGGYTMECWDPVQKWDAQVEWGPDGGYSRINGGETRPCEDFKQAMGAVEVSRERAAFTYDGGVLGCSSASCISITRSRLLRGVRVTTVNLEPGRYGRVYPQDGRVYACSAPGRAELVINGSTTSVDCR